MPTEKKIKHSRDSAFKHDTEKTIKNSAEKKSEYHDPAIGMNKSKVKFEIYGEEMIEKRVKSSGNSGRVYLPPDWIGHQVKIIRID
ncbi:DUF2080 family transposase-associated protein [Desulfonema magnum]|uniref:DUF2080 n=1 Tax=Desulfonema magnum TaxID=45655 RepID=A0A975GQ06_9BACT|nr:DUF2080 family transposase-associated protein [Desulfonema magnum]QTA88453.1 DUF2080 [Desulfonema magnum]